MAGDEDFIRKAICGKKKLFLYIKQVLLKCRSGETEIILDFNDNNLVTKEDIDQIMLGVRFSNINSLVLRLRKIKSEDSSNLVEDGVHDDII